MEYSEYMEPAMEKILKCQHGFAIVYALIVLVLATIGGTSLLFLAQKDRSMVSDYIKMRSASLAAMAAIKACEGQFRKDPEGAFAILKQYTSKNNYQWMLGTAENAKDEQIIITRDGEGAPKYSARILGFDENTALVMIEGTGYGGYGGKKRVIASYQLEGMGLSNRSIGSNHALYLGGALENCNARISIKGDVYLSMPGGGSNQHFNYGGKIYGNLKTAANSSVLDFTGTAELYVSGYAFMQCRLSPQALFKVTGNAGFTYTDFYNFTKAIKVDGNAYFTQTANFGFTSCIDGDSGGGKTVYYNLSKVSSDRFKDFTNAAQIPTSTSDYVAAQLGTTTANEVPFGLNLPASWGTDVAKDISGSVSGGNLDTWWGEKQTAGKLYQGEWLVVNLTGGVSMAGGTFTKKVIWITNSNTITANGKWYNCDVASNTILIVNGSGSLSNMGVPDNCIFRGLIYLSATNETANNQYKFGNKTTLYGAIQHAGKAKFCLNGGDAPNYTDSLRIWYTDPIGQSAMQEIVNTGIILAPGVTAATLPPRVLELLDIKIRSQLISLQM
jgi:hypothetical protein